MADWIGDLITDICELPDRTSPEDYPDHMLVTGDELRGLILRRCEIENERDESRMLQIADLIAMMQKTHADFGNTCVYIRRGGMGWGAVALNRQADDEKHGVFGLQAQHDRDMRERVEQVGRLLASKNDFMERAFKAETEVAAICGELGCTTAPGVALRFAKELRRDLWVAHQRHVELIQTWDTASPTERQELDRLRRGWGPSTPTERMARREDLKSAMRSVEAAMTAVLPDDKEEGEPTQAHFQAAYDELAKAHRDIIALLQALPELSAPDFPAVSTAAA